MHFDDKPEDAAFRAAARAWLEANAPAIDLREDVVSATGEREQEFIRLARQWQAKKYAAGYGAITWPKAFGGMDGGAMQELIFNQEEAKFRGPADHFFRLAMGISLPGVRMFGTGAQ